jgi:hypothetical protein
LIKEGRNKEANVERKEEEHTDNMAITRKEYHTNKVDVFLDMQFIAQGHENSTPA